MRQKAGLGVVELGLEADVREELKAENVLNPHLLRRAAGPGVDVRGEPGQGRLLRADLGRLHDTLRHERVKGAIRIGAYDELADLLVLRDAEGAEENPQRDVGLHAGHGRTEEMDLGILRVIHDLDRVGLRHLVVVGADGLHLNDLHLLCGVAVVAEDDGAIGRHALLRDDDALTTADNEVAAEVLRALAKGDRCQMLLVVEEAVFGADHHRNLAEVHVGEEALTGLTDTAARVVNEGRANADVHKERRGIGQIPHAGVIRHHGQNGAVVLKDGRLAQRHILKHQGHLILVLGTGCDGHCVSGAAHEGVRRGG